MATAGDLLKQDRVIGDARARGGKMDGAIGRSPVRTGNGEDEPLVHVMREIGRELAADGMMMEWADLGGEPACLFADGDCRHFANAEDDLIEAAPPSGNGRSGSARSAWRTLDGDASGGVLTTTIPAASGVVKITTLFKSIGASTRMRARETVSRMLPLVQPFFEMWALRVQALSRVRGLAAAVNNSDVGVLLVDREGRKVFANDAAEALTAQADGIRWNGTMLSGAKLVDTLRLHVAIEHALTATDSRDEIAAPVVAIERQDRRPLMVVISSGTRSGDGGANDVAIIHVFDPEQDFHALLAPICKFYGLSPTEARLACLLADGISLSEAAARMRIRELTARSYLKQIFLKTDTNRQAELVWLLLRSTIHTAPTGKVSLV